MTHPPFTRKHVPKHSSEIIGQASGVAILKRFVANYSTQKKKLLIIHGTPGCGKTASIYAVASEMNLEIIEINASDIRNENAIESIVGAAARQRSLFNTGKIILIDELDGISGTSDRGGVAALTKLVAESSFPIVATANDPWDKKFSALRSKAELVLFNSLDSGSIYSILSKVCTIENISFSEAALKTLSGRSSGDARGALNDLQLLSQGAHMLDSRDIDELSPRDREESIKKAMVKIFKASDITIAAGAFENISENMDEAILWLEENIPLEYKKPGELARAFDCLSKADIFRGRIRRHQHWRFLAYVSFLSTAGVALAKEQKYSSFAAYQPTSRILKIFIANMKYQKRKAIAEKIAAKTHTSKKEAIKSTLPYLAIIAKNDKNAGDQIAREFDLDKEELEWLRK